VTAANGRRPAKATAAKKAPAKRTRAAQPPQDFDADAAAKVLEAAEALAEQDDTDLDSVVLDLDALDREQATGTAPPPLFTFRHKGHTWALMDPADMDWSDVITGLGNPLMFLHYGLGSYTEEERAEFFKEPLQLWKMQALTKRYREHFGLPAVGEADALPGSSRGTARQSKRTSHK
jgi:hypothetical protein